MINTFLLVWNPNRWPWKNLEEERLKLNRAGNVERLWSCRNSRVEIGDRVFIIRLGKEKPRGIFASGVVIEKTEDRHWDVSKSELIPYVRIRFDKLLNPDNDEVKILSREELEESQFQP